jgi:hypothetical protein
MAYTPSVYDSTNPIGSVAAQTAAEEFRVLKAYVRGVIDRVETVTNTTNDSSTVSFMSTTVPAGILGSGKTLKFTWKAHVSNNTGVNQTVTIAVVFGGTTLISSSPTAPPGNTFFNFEFMCTNLNDPAHQVYSAILDVFDNPSFAAPPTPLIALFGRGGAMNESTVDTTADKVFEFTYALGLASVNYGIDSYMALLERI